VGGSYTLASGPWSFVGGGGRQSGTGVAGASIEDNVALGEFSTIGGGQANTTTGRYTAIGGGNFNRASGHQSVVAGGVTNSAGGDQATIAGGESNAALGSYATVAGGKSNTASGKLAFVGGGAANQAKGYLSAVVGGGDESLFFRNEAVGIRSFVGAGAINFALGASSVALGAFNNVADGNGSIAMGTFARTQPVTCPEFGAMPSNVPCRDAHDNAFVYSDGSAGHFRSIGSRSFNVLATGGARFVTAATQLPGAEASATRYFDLLPDGRLSFATGNATKITLDNGAAARGIGVQPGTVFQRTDGSFAWYLNGVDSPIANDPGGGSVLATLTDAVTSTTVTGTFRAQAFTATSDRNQKTDFASIDPQRVLDGVSRLPITSWSYRNEARRGIRHIGPVAQDFYAAFRVGYDDRSITTVDSSGVALAAIQALYRRLQALEAEVQALRTSNEALRAGAGHTE
jgi:hypothetical protein